MCKGRKLLPLLHLWHLSHAVIAPCFLIQCKRSRLQSTSEYRKLQLNSSLFTTWYKMNILTCYFKGFLDIDSIHYHFYIIIVVNFCVRGWVLQVREMKNLNTYKSILLLYLSSSCYGIYVISFSNLWNDTLFHN